MSIDVRLDSRLAQPRPTLSFEFFPPKSPAGEVELWKAIEEVLPLAPDFVSITYGAGGSSRERTIGLASEIQARTGLTAMAHLACVGHSRTELTEIIRRLSGAGIENILALRGDPREQRVPDELRNSGELVALIRATAPQMCVGCAAYPEGHLEAPSKEEDLQRLRQKVDAGANFLISQLFFDNAFYFDFVVRAREAGIVVPIIPGLMPLSAKEQLERFIRMCGATIPERMRRAIEATENDKAALAEFGVAHATAQARELVARRAAGIHFYTLNRSVASRRVAQAVMHGRRAT